MFYWECHTLGLVFSVMANFKDAKGFGDVNYRSGFYRDGRIGQGCVFRKIRVRFPSSWQGRNGITLHEDNEGAINQANFPLSSTRSLHIGRRQYFLREKVAQGHKNRLCQDC